jgi:hypothetical protein
MWRKLGDAEVIEDVGPGLSVALPVGTHFQFRADDLEPLVIVGATMPPWPGMDEAMFVEGIWDATGADHLSRDGRAQNGNKKSRRVLFRSSSKHRHGRA